MTLTKKSLLRLAAITSLVLALAGLATAQGLEPRYTLDDVIDACEDAYSNGQQIDQCIANVCGYYGCEGW